MAETEAVYWRLPSGLKPRVEAYARTQGFSANEAAVRLLEGALGEAGEGVPKGSNTLPHGRTVETGVSAQDATPRPDESSSPRPVSPSVPQELGSGPTTAQGTGEEPVSPDGPHVTPEPTPLTQPVVESLSKLPGVGVARDLEKREVKPVPRR